MASAARNTQRVTQRITQRITQRDWGFALAIGGLLALSPLSSPNPAMSVAVGAAAAALFLGYCFYRAPQAGSEAVAGDAQGAAAADSEPFHRRIPLSSGICLLLFIGVLGPTLQWLYTSWTQSIWINTHGLFIPPIMLYMGYEVLKRERSTEPQASAWGFAFLVPGLLVVVLDSVMKTHYLSVIGLVLCLPGLSLLFLGSERTRRLAFPLFLGVFMIPVPGTFDTTILLRELTAVGASEVLQLMGFTVIREDTVLDLPWGTVIIAKACSGLSTLYSSLTVASILIYYSKTTKRKLIILALTIPMALIANIVRAIVLVMMSQQWGPQILDTQLHEASGVATFAVVLVILYMISDMPGRVSKPA